MGQEALSLVSFVITSFNQIVQESTSARIKFYKERRACDYTENCVLYVQSSILAGSTSS